MNQNRSKASKRFQWALFAVTLILLAYFCISDNNLVTLLHSLPTLNLFWLICAMACVVLNWVLDSSVIKTLLSASFDADYGFRRAFRVTMVGQYFNSVTPYSLAGQPMQLLALTRQGVSSGTALSLLVRKFLLYQTTITCYSLAVIVMKYSFFQSRIQNFMALAFIGFIAQAAIVIVLLLFTRSPHFMTKLINGVVWLLTKIHFVKNPEEIGKKIRNQLEFYLQSNKMMQGDRKMRVKTYVYTFVQLTALFSVPFFLYKAFHNQGFPIVNMIAAQSFVTMISSYTPLPGAAGAAEGSFLIIFQLFFHQNIIRQAMLLWRLITYYSCIIVGAFYAGLENKQEKMRAKFEERTQQTKQAEQAEYAAPETAENGGGMPALSETKR